MHSACHSLAKYKIQDTRYKIEEELRKLETWAGFEPACAWIVISEIFCISWSIVLAAEVSSAGLVLPRRETGLIPVTATTRART